MPYSRFMAVDLAKYRQRRNDFARGGAKNSMFGKIFAE
jgi:hypothetical protein